MPVRRLCLMAAVAMPQAADDRQTLPLSHDGMFDNRSQK
jgi:hypothetical protein